MSSKIFDGTLFPGGLNGAHPKIGRLLPKGCYAGGMITDGPPDRWLMEQEIARNIVQPNRGEMPADNYIEEIGEAAWCWGKPENDQGAIDRRTGFLEVLRDVVGKGPRFCWYDWPMGNIMQAIDWRDPGYFGQWVSPIFHQLMRSRLDVWPNMGATRANWLDLLDGIGLSLYWNTDTSKLMPPGTTEAQAYLTCVEPLLELAHSFGKPVYSFARIMAPDESKLPEGIPVPQDVINTYYKMAQPRGAGAALVIWEAFGWNASGPPKDAPGMLAFAHK
jgi:hypothetical protein